MANSGVLLSGLSEIASLEGRSALRPYGKITRSEQDPSDEYQNPV